MYPFPPKQFPLCFLSEGKAKTTNIKRNYEVLVHRLACMEAVIFTPMVTILTTTVREI
jgi:hypothetical protein